MSASTTPRDIVERTIEAMPPTRLVLFDEALNDARMAVAAMEQGD